MQLSLKEQHFHCKRCDTWEVIETAGVVIAGPACPNCRKQMKGVELVQITLDLFKEPTRQQASVRHAERDE